MTGFIAHLNNLLLHFTDRYIIIFDCHLSSSLSQSQSHIATDGQSASKAWCRAPSGAHDLIIITVWLLRSCFCGAPTLTRGRVCLLYVLLALASPLALGTILYCLRFETSLFVASYDSQGHGIRPQSPHGFLLSTAWDPRYRASGWPPQKTLLPDDSSIVIELCLSCHCIKT
jgi:hypothetical protein